MAGPVPWKKPSILTNSANEQCSGVPGVLLTKEFATSILRGLNLFPGEPHGLGPILLQTEGTRPLLASQSPPLLKYLCLFSASSQPNSYTLQSSCVYVRMHACMHACMYVCVCMYVCLSALFFLERTFGSAESARPFWPVAWPPLVLEVAHGVAPSVVLFLELFISGAA